MPFDLKKSTAELQTTANMYVLSYAIQCLDDKVEQKYYILRVLRKKISRLNIVKPTDPQRIFKWKQQAY